MLRLLMCGIFCLLFTGCITRQKCEDRYPTSTSDSLRIWVTSECFWMHDTIKGEQITWDTSGFIPLSVNYIETHAKGHLIQTVKIKNGKLTAICNEGAYIDSLRLERKTYHETGRHLEIVEKPIRDWLYYFYCVGFWICFSLVLYTIYMLIKVK